MRKEKLIKEINDKLNIMNININDLNKQKEEQNNIIEKLKLNIEEKEKDIKLKSNFIEEQSYKIKEYEEKNIELEKNEKKLSLENQNLNGIIDEMKINFKNNLGDKEKEFEKKINIINSNI